MIACSLITRFIEYLDQFPPVISLCSIFRSSWLSDHLLPSVCPKTICASWLLTLNASSHNHFLQTFSRASHDMSKMCQLVLHHRLEQATVVIEQGYIDNIMWKYRPSVIWSWSWYSCSWLQQQVCTWAVACRYFLWICFEAIFSSWQREGCCHGT